MNDVKESNDRSDRQVVSPSNKDEHLEPRTSPIEHHDIDHETPEERQLRERFEESVDSDALDRIEMKYGRWIPPERLRQARERHFHYIPDEEFDRQLRASDPGLDEDQVRATQGFYAEGVVHVRRNRESLATNMHERLHSVADPRAKERLGNFLYEGMTEEMANWQHDFQYRLHRYERLPDGRLLVRDPSDYYPENKKTFLLLTHHVPESTLLETYFQGDDRRLEACLDARLGKGTWKEVRSLLDHYEQTGDADYLKAVHRRLAPRSNSPWGME